MNEAELRVYAVILLHGVTASLSITADYVNNSETLFQTTNTGASTIGIVIAVL